MSTNDNNGAAPAFPVPRDPLRLRCDGLTKREYVVIEMAKGLLSNSSYGWIDHVNMVRADALRQADALLEVLHEPPASPSPTEGEARKVLESLVKALDELISDSEGVYGLHRNGDISPWDSITEGGFYEEWLLPLSTARAFLSQSTGGGIDE